MRKTITILTFLFLFQISNGQDTVRHLEFGSTLVTINSFSKSKYFSQDRAPIEYLNGFFFRYTKRRLGLRIIANYSENYHSYASPPGWSEPDSGDATNKDFRIGVGGQYSLLKRKEWFYTFLDLSYRNVFSTGHQYGGYMNTNNKFSRTANGFDSFLGLGFKIKTIKHVYLSPEIGYFCSTKLVNQTTTSLNSGQNTKFSYSEINLNPVIKLHLTVKF
jgi:hypothetical protein